MNISSASTFQSVQVKPQTQTASTVALKSKTASSAGTIKDEYVPSQSESAVTVKPHASFKLPSFLSNSCKMQKASSPMSGVTKNLNRMVLEGVITRTLEANGVELKKGDILSMSLNGEGKLTINTNLSRIDGAIGDDLDELSDELSEKLNEAETEEGELLGDALLAMFAADMGFDPEAVKGDPNFSILFSFQYNSQTGRNEIAGARITQMGSQMLKTIATEEPAEPETAKSMNVTFGNAKQ